MICVVEKDIIKMNRTRMLYVCSLLPFHHSILALFFLELWPRFWNRCRWYLVASNLHPWDWAHCNFVVCCWNSISGGFQKCHNNIAIPIFPIPLVALIMLLPRKEKHFAPENHPQGFKRDAFGCTKNLQFCLWGGGSTQLTNVNVSFSRGIPGVWLRPCSKKQSRTAHQFPLTCR